jgi:glycosyltransferase involved in cell wall biosynthesis
VIKRFFSCRCCVEEENLEVVVSDNGSKDGTIEMLKQFDMPCLKVTGFDENQGIDVNILNVIQAAQGEYVFLFSDDDLFTEGLIARLLFFIYQDYDQTVKFFIDIILYQLLTSIGR